MTWNSERPSVTVLIPTFNRAGYIRECLESVLSQTVPPYQVIVIDDGSQDGTAAILNEFEKNVTVIRQPNGGKASAVNLGLKHASGEYVWIFDDDDVALPDSIEKRLAVLDTRPELGFVISGHYLGKDGADGKIVRGTLYEVPCDSEQEIFRQLMNGCYFTLQSILSRTSCYQEIGGLDETLLRSQDYDIMIRLAQHYPCAVLNEPTFIFRKHVGDRGPASIRHSGFSRENIWLEYDRQIGRKIRANVELAKYLPRKTGLNAEGVFDRRSALLWRMSVMASKGMIDEMLDDLEMACSNVDSSEGLSYVQRKICSRAILHPYFLMELQRNQKLFLRRLHEIERFKTGRDAILGFALGFIWLARCGDESAGLRLSRLLMGFRLLPAALPFFRNNGFKL
jgi:glycosyltransferase involved in cell wall biosynthesis